MSRIGNSFFYVGESYLLWGARAKRVYFSLVFQGKKSLFTTGRTSIGCQKQKTKHYSVPRMFVCVIRHRNWPLRSTILNAHGTNASPGGLCTRTHTNEAFSCWFCFNLSRVDRARRGNVCLEIKRRHALLVISLSGNLAMVWVLIWLWKHSLVKVFFIMPRVTYHNMWEAWSGVSAAWCPQQRSRLMPSRTHSSNLHVI